MSHSRLPHLRFCFEIAVILLNLSWCNHSDLYDAVAAGSCQIGVAVSQAGCHRLNALKLSLTCCFGVLGAAAARGWLLLRLGVAVVAGWLLSLYSRDSCR